MKLNKTNQGIFIGSVIGAVAIILIHLVKYSGKEITIDASTSTLGSSTGVSIMIMFAAMVLGMEYGFLKMTESQNSAIRILGIVFLLMWILPAFLIGAGFLLFFFG